MPKYPLDCIIKGGIPIWENLEKKLRLFKFFEGKKVTIYIEEFSNLRSVRQNKYLWGVVYPLAVEGFKDIGYDVNDEDVHGIFGEMFLKQTRINEVTGEEISFVQSTTRMSTKAFEEYTERIRRFAIENLNMGIPLPNEPRTEI